MKSGGICPSLILIFGCKGVNNGKIWVLFIYADRRSDPYIGQIMPTKYGQIPWDYGTGPWYTQNLSYSFPSFTW